MKNVQPAGGALDELFWLQQCLLLIEERVGWGSSHHWTQGNFDRLSNQVCARSGIAISSSTLRRLFVQFRKAEVRRNPQIATKNALAIFLDYDS